MAKTNGIIFTLAVILIFSGANAKTPQISSTGLDLAHLPINQAVYAGTNVTFTCWADNTTEIPRIQWTEYASSANGALISDGDFISPSHPYGNRFTLVRTNEFQYDLILDSAVLADGGVYSCADANAPISQKQRHAGQLIVIDAVQNCTTPIPTDGVTLEGDYYTIECTTRYQGMISPNMQWTGPPPFGQAQSDSGTTVWNGLSFYADRTMNQQFFTSQVNFTDYFLPVPVDTADNIPDFEEFYDSVRLNVYWPPKNMYAEPIKPNDEYLVGDSLECFADAFPTASFQWHNLRTNERFASSIFTIPAEWEGESQTMRCEATNTINGLPQTNDLYIPVNVPAPTTTTPPTTTPTTTTPPAVANCLDLTGRWEATAPIPAQMCVEVNETSGNVHAVIRNDTDTFWVDLVGLTTVPDYDHVSFTGIWPLNRAISTFISECSRCFGEEHLIINAISRSKGGPPCATPGEINYSQEYHFFRNPAISCPPITIPTN